MNHLIETVLLSTHNICFGWETRKFNFRYTLLTKVLYVYEEHAYSIFRLRVDCVEDTLSTAYITL